MATSPGMSAIQSAFDRALDGKLCKMGAWVDTLSEDDIGLLVQKLGSLPSLTVYRVMWGAGVVSFSDKTWSRHVQRRCPCYTSGAKAHDALL